LAGCASWACCRSRGPPIIPSERSSENRPSRHLRE
jgi:hypothetical protein